MCNCENSDNVTMIKCIKISKKIQCTYIVHSKFLKMPYLHVNYIELFIVKVTRNALILYLILWVDADSAVSNNDYWPLCFHQTDQKSNKMEKKGQSQT